MRWTMGYTSAMAQEKTPRDEVEARAAATDLFDRRWVRVGLFVIIPAAVFVLVSAGIRVSQYGIDHTILVFAEDELVAGRTSALRITLIADSGQYYVPESLSAALVRGETRRELFKGRMDDTGYAPGRGFVVPRLGPGPAELELLVRFSEKKRMIRVPVRVVAPVDRVEKKLVIPRIDDTIWPNAITKGDLTVSVHTVDRGAPTGLPSVIFIRLTGKDGAPLSRTLEAEVPASRKDERLVIETGPTGLDATVIKPSEMSYPLVFGELEELEAPEASPDDGLDSDGETPSEVVEIKKPDSLHPRVIYGGISASVHNPVVLPGDPLRATAYQISSGGPLYADVFCDGVWTQAASFWFAGTAADIELHPAAKGICRLQLTTSALAPGRTVAVRHFYVLEEGQSVLDAVRDLVSRLKNDVEHEKWARAVEKSGVLSSGKIDERLVAAFALSQLYEGHRELPRLLSSRKDDDEQLAVYKDRFQRGLMIAILLIGLGVASLIGLIAIGAGRRQRRITLMILAEGDDSSGMYHTEDGAKAKGRIAFQGLVLFLIILGAFAAVAVLVDTMRWGY